MRLNKKSQIYKNFVEHSIEPPLVFNAYKLCCEVGMFKNINDAIHLKFAEKYCSNMVTFDKDFNYFKDKTKIIIEVLEP